MRSSENGRCPAKAVGALQRIALVQQQLAMQPVTRTLDENFQPLLYSAYSPRHSSDPLPNLFIPHTLRTQTAFESRQAVALSILFFHQADSILTAGSIRW